MSARCEGLQDRLPQGEVLLPGTPAYEKAVFIGNLEYSYKQPACVVMAAGEADVQATVRFAREHDVRLNVKNGGHSYAGYCLNVDGIVLDSSRMAHFEVHDDQSVTIQGGAIWYDVYQLLRGRYEQYMLVGGQCPTVGVSGFTLGGGLSPFSRSYGLSVDNLLEMAVVTADGEVVTLSPHDHDPARRDLFWGVRGGGGGNFGVTTKMRVRLHPLPERTIVAGELTWDVAASAEQDRLFRQAMEAFNTMPKPNELCMDVYCSFGGDGLSMIAQMTVIYNGPKEQCDRVIAPLLACRPAGNSLESMHWTQWEKEELGFAPESAIYHHYVSFVLPDGAIVPEVTDQILELLETSPALVRGEDGGWVNKNNILWDNIGGVTTLVPAEATAFPWRDGVYVMSAKAVWSEADQTAEAYAWTDRCREVFTPYAIEGKAAYLNYIDGSLTDWQSAYYGNNYPRLREVKARWDPDDFFRFEQSIEPAGA